MFKTIGIAIIIVAISMNVECQINISGKVVDKFNKLPILFKASIIKDNPSFVSNGKLAGKLKSHNLINLAKLANIELTQNEQIFCKQAFNAMIVESRYPVALESEPINGVTEIGGNCKEVFETLYNKLYPTLGQINK